LGKRYSKTNIFSVAFPVNRDSQDKKGQVLPSYNKKPAQDAGLVVVPSGLEPELF
jgi:hypothetical protein